MSGLLGQLTDLDSPEPVGISLSDHLAGIFAAYGVLGALMARERTGLGQRVDTSLLQASTAVVAENLTRYLATGEALTRASRARVAQVFAFKDRGGSPFVIHLSSPDKFWLALLDAVGRRDLAADARFATREARQSNREAVQELFDKVFATGTRQDWLARLQAHDVPCAPLNSLDEVVADPQVHHLGLVADVTHPAMGSMKVMRGGVNLQSTPLRLGAAPTLDEHRDAILAELGFPPGFLDQPSS
jgi:crotonobetainyl-CoA:carnitine CoA-transferase CaiB-like acyl-CoA transferase